MYIIPDNEFDLAYRIMEASFPNSELRTYPKIKEYFEREMLILYGIKNDGMLVGVIMCWECDSCIFLENFAVNGKVRGNGIGSVLLNDVKQRYHGKLIILEVEEPFDDLSRRRIAFYERNGFILSDYGYMQPQINEQINEIPLLLMCYPHHIEKDQFEAIRGDLFTNVYMLEHTL